MKTGRILGCILIVGIVPLIVFLLNPRPEPPEIPEDDFEAVKSVAGGPQVELSGDAMLTDYGGTNRTASEDLRQVLRVFDNALILVKRADTRHYATNEDLAGFLRGANPDKFAMVSSSSRLFGEDGLILDRWGNPLIVHPVRHGKIELRSAGPDGVAWNDDDVLVDSPL